MDNDYEYRSFAGDVELRNAGDTQTVVGYASVYNSTAEIRTKNGTFHETIAPGAFDGLLAKRDLDTSLLVEHEGLPLGRTPNTLKLTSDAKGLRYECALDMSNPDAQRLCSLLKRGDIRGSSFGFKAGRDSWEKRGNDPHRTVHEVSTLFDVGPVVNPAYTATEASMRSLDAWEKELEKAREAAQAQLNQSQYPVDLAESRLRLLKAFGV